MAHEVAAPQASRSLGAVVRYLVGAAIGIIVLLLLVQRRSDLTAAWRQLGSADPGWVAAAIATEALSLLAFACLQRAALRLSGSRVPLRFLSVLALANEAIANTVPGEPAVSSAYRYRQYRRHGASGASAGWTIFTVLVAQAMGMSVLLLLGVGVALLGSRTANAVGAAAAGLIIVIVAAVVLARRDLVLRLVGAAARAGSRLTHARADGILPRVELTLARMREIPLRMRSSVGIVLIASAVWGLDFLCLLCSFGAVRAAVPWDGVLLAYGVAQVVGSFPLVPGGLGIIEGSLAVVLTAYGASHVPAIAVALAYRIVSFWLAIAIGWISVALIALSTRRTERLGPAAPPRE